MSPVLLCICAKSVCCPVPCYPMNVHSFYSLGRLLRWHSDGTLLFGPMFMFSAPIAFSVGKKCPRPPPPWAPYTFSISLLWHLLFVEWRVGIEKFLCCFDYSMILASLVILFVLPLLLISAVQGFDLSPSCLGVWKYSNQVSVFVCKNDQCEKIGHCLCQIGSQESKSEISQILGMQNVEEISRKYGRSKK